MPRTVDPVIAPGVMGTAPQQTIIIDETLAMRPFRTSDADVVQRAFADPDIQHWHGFRIDTTAEAEAWIARALELWTEEKSAVWAITDAERVLGRCALHIDARFGLAEVAYWVLPEARGQSVAVRAAVAATSWAHETLGVHRVCLQHSTRNPVSCSVARRAGFAAEGVAREQQLHDDGWHDMHQHAHLSTD